MNRFVAQAAYELIDAGDGVTVEIDARPHADETDTEELVERRRTFFALYAEGSITAGELREHLEGLDARIKNAEDKFMEAQRERGLKTRLAKLDDWQTILGKVIANGGLDLNEVQAQDARDLIGSFFRVIYVSRAAKGKASGPRFDPSRLTPVSRYPGSGTSAIDQVSG